MRRLAISAALVVVGASALAAPTALANDNAQTAVAGANSKWFSGTLMQLPGDNCSVLGMPYTETMVSAIAEYGGAPNGDIPSVGQPYWAAVLISIPGNPCGPGSSAVATDVALPPGTTVDTSRPIRCFGVPRGQQNFVELTGGGWSFNGFSGQYCPATVGSSLTGNGGVAVGVGFRPLASGQLYELFVPVISSSQLIGAGHAPPDQTVWFLSPTGTYSNIGETSVWTNVVPAGNGNSPFIYFARNPSVQPYWVVSPNDGGPNSRVEFFANLYSAFKPGSFCFALYEPDPAHDANPFTCGMLGASWNSAVTNASDTWQITGNGPNGGFPLGLAMPPVLPNEPFTMRWTFTPTSGPAVSKDITFNAIGGPDADGDGVPDASDACPSVKGTLANGCQPAVQSDPDGDGVYGAADKCPTQNGSGSLDGCPPPVTTQPTLPTTPTTQTVPTNTTITTIPKPPLRAPTLKSGKASATLKGSTITINTGLSIGCPAGGPSCPVSLTGTISGAQAAKAKKKKPKPLTVGSARLTVASGNTVAITFRLSSKAKSLLAKHHRLTITLAGSATTGPGGPKTQIKKSISVSNPPKRKSKHH